MHFQKYADMFVRFIPRGVLRRQAMPTKPTTNDGAAGEDVQFLRLVSEYGDKLLWHFIGNEWHLS